METDEVFIPKARGQYGKSQDFLLFDVRFAIHQLDV